MFGENSVIKNAAAALQTAFLADDVDAAVVQSAFETFAAAVAETVKADFESANGDKSILAQRGFRVLTSEEEKYYQKVIDLGKSDNPRQAYGGLVPDAMPETVIEDVYRNLVQEHPLLNKINFVNVKYLTRWILNDHSQQTAVWGDVTATISAKIESAFRVVEIAQCKLSAYAEIERSMLDLGPVFLDAYIRTFLKEALAGALEKAIVCGTGASQPIGFDRDIHHGVSVTLGAYPQKTPVEVTSFTPVEYGELLAMLAETEVWYTEDSSGDVIAAATAANDDGSAKSGYTKHGGAMRNFQEVTLICNLKDYLSKVMPATTVQTAIGTYVRDLFPFPTDVVVSAHVPTGYAIVCLPEEYFFGIGASKEGNIEFSDEFKFLEDKRVFKIKTYGNGTPIDDTCAVLVDISGIEPAYIFVKDMNQATPESE